MFSQFKITLRRSQETLLQDAMGAMALVVILLASLYMPAVL